MSGQDKPGRPEPHLAETRVSSEQVYGGRLLDVRRDKVRLPDGTLTTREYIVHPGAVVMVPVRDDGRLVLVRQFRYPLERVFVEFPAGKLDPGEDTLTTARRELLEETGHVAERWTYLGVIHPVISYSTEAIAMYRAEGLRHQGAALDDGEFLEVIDCSVDDLLAALDRGEITDAKTVTALLLHNRHVRCSSRPAWPGRVIARRLVISGKVQGVGYRDGMLAVARAAGVTGWVRNRPDGTVEAVVQGDETAFGRVLAWCRQGPRLALVNGIDTQVLEVDSALGGFERRPTG